MTAMLREEVARAPPLAQVRRHAARSGTVSDEVLSSLEYRRHLVARSL